MIIIYGDHCSGLTWTHYSNLGALEPTWEIEHEAAMMIKYPFQTTGVDVNDREVFSPQVNGIIKDFVDRTHTPTTDYMSYFQDHKFDLRILPIMSYNKKSGSHSILDFVEYSGNKLRRTIDPTKISPAQLSISHKDIMATTSAELDNMINVVTATQGVD